MSIFGGLFGHDKVSARSSGKYDSGQELPPLPGQSPVFPQAPPAPQMGPPSEGLVQAPQLPPAPPSRKPSLFDKDHRRETFLAIASGMGQGLNFGEGLGAAAQNLYGLQRGLREEGKPQLGGPDNSFEVYTDPETGEHRFVPIKEAHEYLTDKRNRVTPKDLLDFNGRYAMQLNGITDPAQRATAEQYMASNPDLFPGFNKALIGGNSVTTGLVADNGQNVTQARTTEQRALAEDHRQDYRQGVAADRAARTAITARKADASISQGAARIGLSAAAGARAERKAAASGDGYEYRTVNGKIQRRKIK